MYQDLRLLIYLPPPFNASPGRVGMEAANELFLFFKTRPEGGGGVDFFLNIFHSQKVYRFSL